jgi:hypothetical protein
MAGPPVVAISDSNVSRTTWVLGQADHISVSENFPI